MNSTEKRNVPLFTQEQLDYLDGIFFENTTVPSDPNTLYIRLGQRQVIHEIKLAIERSKRGNNGMA